MATETELNQDSINLSPIRFELCDCLSPGKQQVEGGPAVVEEKEKNNLLLLSQFQALEGPSMKEEEISFMYRLRRSVSLPHPKL